MFLITCLYRCVYHCSDLRGQIDSYSWQLMLQFFASLLPQVEMCEFKLKYSCGRKKMLRVYVTAESWLSHPHLWGPQ